MNISKNHQHKLTECALRGIVPPVVTPLHGVDELDHLGLERLIEGMVVGGVHALFLLGTTGEGPALSYALRRAVIEQVCNQVKGRVPVLVGISDTSYCESLRMAEIAAKAGASAVVAAAPYYFMLQQEDLRRLIASWARDLPLPAYLYNFPALTKVWFEPATVAYAMEFPRICGIKDSSGDLAYLAKLLAMRQKRPDFAVLVGQEHLLAEALEMGADGGVPGGANLFPRLITRLYESFEAGDISTMRRLQAEVVRMGDPIFHADEAGSSYVARLKCALALCGLCSDLPAWPGRRVTEAETGQIRLHLQHSGLLAAKAAHGGA